MLDLYYVRNRHTQVCVGDKLGGKVSVKWKDTRHVFEGTYERAERFLLAEAYAIMSHAPGLWEIVPVSPQTCQWSPDKHTWNNADKCWI